MRNISVPTNDTMIFAVHGNTVDECIADCAKLMAYLTKGAQPENDTVDDDDYDADDYDDYELNSSSNTVYYRYYYCDGYEDRVPSDDAYSDRHECIKAAYEELKNSRVYKEYYRDYVNDCLENNVIPNDFEDWFYSLDDDELLYIEECKVK